METLAAEYRRTFYISANESNPEGELALNILLGNIIEIAYFHANSLGIGNAQMQHLNAGWVLSRLTVEMDSFPKVNTDYHITTWVEEFNKHYSIRDFMIEDCAGNIIGYARTIWMVLDTTTHESIGLSHLDFSQSLISSRPCPIARQAKHLMIITPEMVEKMDSVPARILVANHSEPSYTFKYNDIDFYRHVNTVRYLTVLVNCFSIDDFDKNYVKRLEMSFLNEGHFGEPVEIRRYDRTELESDFLLYSEARDQQVLYARIFMQPRLL